LKLKIAQPFALLQPRNFIATYVGIDHGASFATSLKPQKNKGFVELGYLYAL
jgi:hypothetical protein